MGTPVGDEIRAEQLGTGSREGDGIQPQGATDAGVRVEAEALGIGDREEEEVKGEGVGTAAGSEPNATRIRVAG